MNGWSNKQTNLSNGSDEKADFNKTTWSTKRACVCLVGLASLVILVQKEMQKSLLSKVHNIIWCGRNCQRWHGKGATLQAAWTHWIWILRFVARAKLVPQDFIQYGFNTRKLQFFCTYGVVGGPFQTWKSAMCQPNRNHCILFSKTHTSKH